MIDRYADLRIFLISIGMLQVSYYSYATEIPSDKYRNINVYFDLTTGELRVVYPDIEYNMQNPYSPKKRNNLVKLNTDDLELCKHMIVKTISNFM